MAEARWWWWLWRQEKENTKSLGSPTYTARKGSEGVTGPDVLKLLRHLRWSSVQFLRDILLFVGLHGIELLTEVSINHILYREVIGTKALGGPVHREGMLRPQVHFNMLEEVMVFMGCEWNKDANSSR